MSLSLRAMLIPLTVVLVFAGIGFTCPQWTAAHGFDFWKYSEYEESLRQNVQEMETLNESGVRVRQRVFMKLAITQNLISKRIDLAQATDQFLELNAIEPELLPDVRRCFPAATPEESVIGQILNFVRTELRSDPSRLSETLCDLERQRQEIRRRTTDCE